jgi:poly(beta-D-mannuronate) lyase
LLPSEILDLSCWYLTLPINNAQSIKQPALATYENTEYFFVRDEAVVFTAPCGGATTKHSNYPRCELRETVPAVGSHAAWSTEVGLHAMTLTGATLVLPPIKPQVVLAQIHDASNDMLEVVADGRATKGKVVITVRWQGEKPTTFLDSDYVLGTPYTLSVTATQGVMGVAYSCGTTSNVLRAPLERAGCYFKAGCYTQSNPSRGDSPTSFGQTMLTALGVIHDA